MTRNINDLIDEAVAIYKNSLIVTHVGIKPLHINIIEGCLHGFKDVELCDICDDKVFDYRMLVKNIIEEYNIQEIDLESLERLISFDRDLGFEDQTFLPIFNILKSKIPQMNLTDKQSLIKAAQQNHWKEISLTWENIRTEYYNQEQDSR